MYLHYNSFFIYIILLITICIYNLFVLLLIIVITTLNICLQVLEKLYPTDLYYYQAGGVWGKNAALWVISSE